MKNFVILTSILVITQALPPPDLQQKWKDFKLAYDKKYENKTEELQRMEIFSRNSRQIVEHNKKYERGFVTYKKGVNQFAGMIHEEFLKTLSLPNHTKMSEKGLRFVPPDNKQLPDSVDWRHKQVVLPVTDYYYCGSWCDSAIGTLTSHFAIKTGKLIMLSRQNLIDCSAKYGNTCTEGSPTNAFRYVKENGGIDTSQSYPDLDNKEIGDCRYNPNGSVGTIKDFATIEPGNEDHLQYAVATYGPVSVTINMEPLQDYIEGVFDEDCDPSSLTTSLLVVGYGTTDDGRDYWIVKGTWGEAFGENGYISLARNKNQCGIASAA